MTENSVNTAKQTLPYAVAVLVLGILSIVCSCFILGLIFGIIGLVISKDGKKAYLKDPDKYDGYGALNAGRVLSIIGIVLGGLTLFYWLIILAVGGTILGILTQFVNW